MDVSKEYYDFIVEHCLVPIDALMTKYADTIKMFGVPTEQVIEDINKLRDFKEEFEDI